MKRSVLYTAAALIGFSILSQSGFAQKKLSEQLTLTAMEKLFQDTTLLKGAKGPKWTYDMGVVLEGAATVWRNTGDGKYFKYIQNSMNAYLDKEGNINTYKPDDFNIDNIKNGRSLLLLYKVTGQQKYLLAATKLYDQLQKQPRTQEGGFWHKKIYPNQMWLDGLYMGEPFYAEYARLMKKDEAFDDIAKQFILMEKNARDVKTGLLYHGYDESRTEQWADKKTGRSANFWGRAMGWYIMALVDVLDNFPANHPQRKELIAILNRTATAAVKYQDQKSGVWFDILDLPTRKGNYLESSASSMFVYGLAKGVRKGWLAPSFMAAANKGYTGLKKEFVEQAGPERINLTKTVSVSGLGGKPKYRDGSFDYYISEKVITNDPKGVGSFICAASEMEIDQLPKAGKGLTVTLDNFFNNEYMTGPTGDKIPFHYLWEEDDNNGFSLFGKVFNDAGVKTATLKTAPTTSNLKGSNIYIIVDPDTEKETANPNFMNAIHAKQVSDWVKAGGVLVLLLNDAGNCEISKFNVLPETFGIHFNEDSRNKVQGSNFEQGAVKIPAGNSIFKTAKKVYIKEISTIVAKKTAVSALTDNGDVLIATAKYGKGTVFSVGDPWFYNEYIDGRKLPADFENFKATNDLVNWLIKQALDKK
ncbi:MULTISPECIES: glycoside hydrolase family 88 protein [unclassified Pedobacter]|uniref:glycoside hydrolase family 88/105 protein n=1 Tax=unclassified Pedobacter TaxID=2628915 RepID=UPI00141FA481|nr:MULTISPECIES: glycoside hydrolase family 88 protein [unclassified Pedobacter]NII84169.1 unsaturated rhamnogalacturonyl hydrolase [Pedobacter sp. SG908]NMN38915.1 unsaturated rhamnogalacturonyl hydrolase [Pedobacter sp. SG918]